MKQITVVEMKPINLLPPVQNIIKAILSNGYSVKFVGRNISKISPDILNHENFSYFEIPELKEKNIVIRQFEKRKIYSLTKKYVAECMESADFLWTTSISAVLALKRDILKYKNIFQLMELTEYAEVFGGRIKIRVDNFARKAWKVVVPEINRAYIQKVWWQLPTNPVVLPNKPYDLKIGEVTSELNEAIHKMQSEKKKIILYLGVIGSDRNLEEIAKVAFKSDTYAFYIVGKFFNTEGKEELSAVINKYGAVYLGEFDPPNHLALVKYAYIGILPYKPIKAGGNSSLNALYCAPNKIWEYAGFGVPMVGSDVLGLKFPFELWNIGRCCDLNDETSIIKAIEDVDINHDKMSQNCYSFYNSIDLNKIVSGILDDEV